MLQTRRTKPVKILLPYYYGDCEWKGLFFSAIRQFGSSDTESRPSLTDAPSMASHQHINGKEDGGKPKRIEEGKNEIYLDILRKILYLCVHKM
jgi:hypothetical protein